MAASLSTTSLTSGLSHGPLNTSAEEQAMRRAVDGWARQRWPDARMIDELVLGERRIDRVYVRPNDIIGIEFKGPRDTVTGERISKQMREFNFYLPEVWLAVHARLADHEAIKYYRNVLVVSDDGVVTELNFFGQQPYRDELCCSRLLDHLWKSEALAIGARRGLIQPQLGRKWKEGKIKSILARMLTGHEIMQECCAELRSRPLTGLGSDKPTGRTKISGPTLFD